jgi:hypothetical protein
VRDASAYQSGKSSRLVLMGDSITEAWVGTGYGSPTPRAEGVPAVLNETLARHWPPTPLVLAISGDQTLTASPSPSPSPSPLPSPSP